MHGSPAALLLLAPCCRLTWTRLSAWHAIVCRVSDSGPHSPPNSPAILCRRRGGITPEDLAGLRQPTWCRLLPQHFRLLLDRASRSPYPETLMFVSRGGRTRASTASGSGSEDSSAPHREQSSGSSNGSGASDGGAVDEYGVPDAVSQALAEARLMVADAAANHTAAAVQQLAAAASSGGAASVGTEAAAERQQQQRQQPSRQLIKQQQMEEGER